MRTLFQNTFSIKLELNYQQLTNTKGRLVMYGGNKISQNCTILECHVCGRKYELPFFIVDTNAQAIMGKNACTEIESIVRVHSVENDKGECTENV